MIPLPNQHTHTWVRRVPTGPVAAANPASDLDTNGPASRIQTSRILTAAYS